MTHSEKHLRLAAAVLAVFILRATPAGADITGSVGITLDPTGTVRSAGIVEFWNEWGTNIDDNVTLIGTHSIHRSVNSGSIYASQTIEVHTGQWHGNLSFDGLNDCARARLQARAYDPPNMIFPAGEGDWPSAWEVCNSPDEGPDDEGDTQCYEYCSPILLDLDGDGFHLGGIDDAVSFDIDGNGVRERLAWTSRHSEDAFLALDRNGNGQIDSGAELFGNRTPMVSGGSAANGYDALFEYDRETWGGNGNQLIDPGDAVFGSLLVWIDRNHDGATGMGELSTLAAAGVLDLECSYQASRHRDRHGNYFRYKGTAGMTTPAGHRRVTQTYDVFLRLAE
jgi:hypothetical protein